MCKSLVLALLVILLVVFPARAQNNLPLALVEVDIWPEYDQPSTLVIYQIALAPNTSLPTTLTLRIPSGAQINMVASQDASDNLVAAQYERMVNGEWTALEITVTSLQIRVEYYDGLDKVGTQRQIAFEWPGDYPTDVLEVNFLQPKGARNVIISPASSVSTGQNGLTNHRIRTANLAAGQTFTLTVEYERGTNDLSIAGSPIEAAVPLGPNTPGHFSATGVLPWILGTLGVLLLVFGVIVGFHNWRRGNRLLAISLGPKRGARGRVENICQQCGKRAQPGDVFCRTCGTRLRDESEGE